MLHVIIIDPTAEGSSIKYEPKIFRKTDISYPLIRTRMCASDTHTVRIGGLEILVFRKILRTYLMDDLNVNPNKLRW